MRTELKLKIKKIPNSHMVLCFIISVEKYASNYEGVDYDKVDVSMLQVELKNMRITLQ